MSTQLYCTALTMLSQLNISKKDVNTINATVVTEGFKSNQGNAVLVDSNYKLHECATYGIIILCPIGLILL